MKKIAFVIPWYGENISGGAEAECRGAVKHLKAAGVDVEVLTTCVKSFTDDWNTDFHQPGLTEEGGVPVRRFPVRKRNTGLFDQVNLKLMNNRQLTANEEEIFCREMVNSSALYEYIRDHGDEYDLFLFIPYMFGTTYYGCQIWPEKSVLIPCLHDESYAYMKVFRKAFSKVRGMIFHAEPERALAEKLYGVSGPLFENMGEGLNTDWEFDAGRFREKYHIEDPFVLYAGRKDAGKRVDMLVRFFAAFKERNPGKLKLVLIGGGKIDIPDTGDIIDLGFVDVQDKYDAYGAAEFFCNPSEMESFSLVVMESWLAGRPVLVNGKCAVTKDFAIQARGGLYFDNYWEFEAAVNYLLSHPDIAGEMGENGKRFVMSNFTWDVIVDRYIRYFKKAVGMNSDEGVNQ